MSNLINWAKTNIVTVSCCVVILLCLAVHLVLTMPAGQRFSSELTQADRTRSELNRLTSGSLNGPARTDGEPLAISRPINEADVAQLATIFKEMNGGYSELFKLAVDFNRGNHELLVQGLFPKPNTAGGVLESNAHMAYSRAFFSPGGNGSKPGLYQQLGANVAPTPQEIEAAVTLAGEQFKQKPGLEGANLVDAERVQLAETQAAARRELIISRAAETRVYVEKAPQFNRQVLIEPGPFSIGDWAAQSTRPEIDDLWEGQMALWIQQDLVDAINLANHSANPNPAAHVASLPVKRLIKIEVTPGYILPKNDPNATSIATDEQGNPKFTEPDHNQPLARDFSVSGTGRTSNALFDVRTAKMSVIIDVKRIPLLLNAISRINFMTATPTKITAVDEYAEFEAGYFYGQGVDVVQLDLDIESLWLRRWTYGHTDRMAILEYQHATPTDTQFNNLTNAADKIARLKAIKFYDLGLMPDQVRWNLSLPPRDPEFQPTDASRSGNFRNFNNRGFGGEPGFEEGR